MGKFYIVDNQNNNIMHYKEDYDALMIKPLLYSHSVRKEIPPEASHMLGIRSHDHGSRGYGEGK